MNRNCITKVLCAMVIGFLLSLVMPVGDVSAEEKVIRFMTTETDPNTRAALKGIIAEFEKMHPGIRVAPEFSSWSDINKKLLTALAAGDPPRS